MGLCLAKTPKATHNTSEHFMTFNDHPELARDPSLPLRIRSPKRFGQAPQPDMLLSPEPLRLTASTHPTELTQQP